MTGGREDGRIMLLGIGFLAVGLMLIAMVSSVAAVHLDRKHLFDLADSLAVAGADSMSPDDYYDQAVTAPDGTGTLTLTDATVAQAVREHLGLQPAGTAPGLRDVVVVDASTPDGRSATVTLAATSHPPLLRWFTDALGGGFSVTATATARAG
ncbi:hypothetical protein ATJ88_1217 [Isoptericola jiangsuensis]|uniref:Flp pilus-assembly TadE/G-like protein n=1 Tax=Isoptericola jiangsuensis TaxID=548579 RepID=A0A2A9EWD3_9MICO|nr:hypothetical protein [Isoptericola jiangsuensis]PFG42555.1 hypothetical protein ATJ88_1217 [Isoptericola jiangsuensis]